MSTTTLNFRLKVSGALTDATSVVLRDPTGAFGVRRLDNGDVAVSAGTAMTHASLGLYTFSFTDPAPALVYTWFAEFVYNGATNHLQFTAQGGGATPTAPSSTIEANAAGPRRVTGDSGSIEQHSLPDQIAADLYLKSQQALTRRPLGFRTVKLRPGNNADVDTWDQCR